MGKPGYEALQSILKVVPMYKSLYTKRCVIVCAEQVLSIHVYMQGILHRCSSFVLLYIHGLHACSIRHSTFYRQSLFSLTKFVLHFVLMNVCSTFFRDECSSGPYSASGYNSYSCNHCYSSCVDRIFLEKRLLQLP